MAPGRYHWPSAPVEKGTHADARGLAAGTRRAAPDRLVDYPSLPSVVWETVAPHFGQAVDVTLRARVQSGAAMDAKAPIGRPAVIGGDAAAKQAAAGESLRREVDRHARHALARIVAPHAAMATAAG